MDQNEAIVKARKYLALIENLVHVESAYLFGSYANGAPREDSDIDIGIFSKAPRDYFSIRKKLFAARKMVDTLIEPHLLDADYDESGFHDVVRKGLKLL